MLKRTVDIVVSLIGLFLLAPFMAAIALWIRVDSSGPVFYRGRRVGRHGKEFRIFKFRSMVVDAERKGGASASDGDRRITRPGRFIRRYKLDEVAQLINVLKGDMSLVGPRPEVQKYVDLYTEEERAILGVRPGITDWASIWNSDEGGVLAGAADPDKAYEELIRPTKLKLQLHYVRTRTLWCDVRIIFFTLRQLVCRSSLPREIAPYGRLTAQSIREASGQRRSG
jgi:lipopolysaccharide/colanic/teichoic acid biosynthesis glycosyltransferase